MMSENENEKRKTVADILAEYRNDADAMDRGELYQPTTEYVRRLLDRIEEAWEREREELDKRISDLEAYAKLWTGRADELRLKCDELYAKAKPVGNAAAMRDALVALRDAARNFYHQILNSKYSDIMDEYKCRERGLPALLDLRYAIPKANAALSAPARNCDLYSNVKEALKAHEEAFDEDNFQHGECRLGCPGCDDGLIDCKILWLFATAERKGEGDGIK